MNLNGEIEMTFKCEHLYFNVKKSTLRFKLWRAAWAAALHAGQEGQN